ncbi:unnamed protein product [Taenia asiatica]|uniref:Uncharacterized protein n=1 Tax=Taenia asiatica TaxID=60517 RepID=A0A0R3W0E9_TAEAS|nr:unnamed protein product [Taenia asiatica]
MRRITWLIRTQSDPMPMPSPSQTPTQTPQTVWPMKLANARPPSELILDATVTSNRTVANLSTGRGSLLVRDTATSTSLTHMDLVNIPDILC